MFLSSAKIYNHKNFSVIDVHVCVLNQNTKSGRHFSGTA